MKTAVIFETISSTLSLNGVSYFVVGGDYSDCNGHYVNDSEDTQIIERIVFEIQTDKNQTDIEGFKQAILEGAELIQCGFYL